MCLGSIYSGKGSHDCVYRTVDHFSAALLKSVVSPLRLCMSRYIILFPLHESVKNCHVRE